MATIKRTNLIILALLLILPFAVTADAQRRGGQIRRVPRVRAVGGQTVEYHPWPAATCPICATRAARYVVAELRARGMSPEEMSQRELTDLLRSWNMEISPTLVRQRLQVAQDHERLETANAENGLKSYAVEVETRVAPGGRATYVVYDGGYDPVYLSSDYKEMVRFIEGRAGSGKTINLSTRNMTRAKANALRRTLNIQQGGVEGARTSYSTPGARLVEGSMTEPTFIRRGKFKGFYTASLRFMNMGHRLTLRAYARLREVLTSMLDRVAASLSRNPSRESMEQLVNRARAELQVRYNLTEEDLRILIEDELMNTFFVQIPRLAPSRVGD